MTRTFSSRRLVAAAAALFAAPCAHAFDIQSGDWKFSFNGNINVHYINSQCEKHPDPIVTVGGACTKGAPDDKSDVSTVSNGLLPAAAVLGVSTTQQGWDITGTFGLYPGISTNDGGSPNLEQNGGALGTNTALGTTGLDVRQVFMTFGTKEIGTFTLGRNFGLFGFDAIINDMTLPGVGVAGAAGSGAPSNTTLGSIGFGYIYTDTLAQMNYTTPDIAGFKFTAGIFDPVEPLLQDRDTPESSPGFHGKAQYTNGPMYFSASFITQKQEGDTNDGDFTSKAFDIGGKYKFGPFEVLGWFYGGKGMGTTALFTLSDDGAGHARKSDGFLAQATYSWEKFKFGVNYGESNLKYAHGEDRDATPNLLKKNSKVTGGVYYSLTKNLTLLGEFSGVKTEAHGGNENKASNINFGAFLAF